MRPDVRLRHSLLVRLVAASVLVAVTSIVATAWLAVRGTTSALEEAQGQALSDDATIYDALLDYAATHPSWNAGGPLVRDLARRTGREITLTSGTRAVLVRSPERPSRLPAKPSAVVDALETDPQLKPNVPSRIDPRAVGPYRLSSADRAAVRQVLAEVEGCVKSQGDFPTKVVEQPSGRADLVLTDDTDDGAVALTQCRRKLRADGLAGAERTALTALQTIVDRCLREHDHPPVELTIGFGWHPVDPKVSVDEATVQDCVDAGRRQQLKPTVAPPALLFVRSPGPPGRASFELSRANLRRIAGVTALILAITVALTVLLAVRLVRPLRALTAAARNPAAERARVQVTSRDEIGALAQAFNELSDRRERAEEQRQAMVRDVAHELRTPLTNIRTWLEACEDGLAGPETDPVLASALLREATQLQRMIEDLQDLAAADAGELRLRPEEVNVRDLLDQVATAHQGSADAAGIALRTRTIGDPVLVGDGVRLRQALANLVSNALRYTPPGGQITVRASEDGADVAFEVADTGCGITADDLPYVFDRFWRADPSRTRGTGGSGLGLAIVRHIAELHGGRVSAESSPGDGARFTLRIPREPLSMGHKM